MLLDDQTMDRLAVERGLFHLGDEGEALARGITRPPLEAIRSVVRPGMRTLETGCGGTTVVFAAQGARHTAISPSADEHRRVREYCGEMGVASDDVEFLVGSSDDVLPSWTEELDVVLVDGAHRMPFPLIDWHYTARHLKAGGHMFVDDVSIPAVYVLFQFLQGDPDWRLIGVPGDKTAHFQKIAEPAVELNADWELQSYNYPWKYGHIPLQRRWRKFEEKAYMTPWLRRLLRKPPLIPPRDAA
jgi:precorrin-6B methylase 2